jgi:hypothetical protein
MTFSLLRWMTNLGVAIGGSCGFGVASDLLEMMPMVSDYPATENLFPIAAQ